MEPIKGVTRIVQSMDAGPAADRPEHVPTNLIAAKPEGGVPTAPR